METILTRSIPAPWQPSWVWIILIPWRLFRVNGWYFYGRAAPFVNRFPVNSVFPFLSPFFFPLFRVRIFGTEIYGSPVNGWSSIHDNPICICMFNCHCVFLSMVLWARLMSIQYRLKESDAVIQFGYSIGAHPQQIELWKSSLCPWNQGKGGWEHNNAIYIMQRAIHSFKPSLE